MRIIAVAVAGFRGAGCPAACRIVTTGIENGTFAPARPDEPVWLAVAMVRGTLPVTGMAGVGHMAAGLVRFVRDARGAGSAGCCGVRARSGSRAAEVLTVVGWIRQPAGAHRRPRRAGRSLWSWRSWSQLSPCLW